MTATSVREPCKVQILLGSTLFNNNNDLNDYTAFPRIVQRKKKHLARCAKNVHKSKHSLPLFAAIAVDSIHHHFHAFRIGEL